MAKKSFKNANPAMQFIGQPAVMGTVPADAANAPLPAGPHQAGATPPMKPNPLYVETKSRRLNLLLQPSLHDRIKAIANERGASVNDTVHQILQEYTDSRTR